MLGPLSLSHDTIRVCDRFRVSSLPHLVSLRYRVLCGSLRSNKLRTLSFLLSGSIFSPTLTDHPHPTPWQRTLPRPPLKDPLPLRGIKRVPQSVYSRIYTLEMTRHFNVTYVK